MTAPAIPTPGPTYTLPAVALVAGRRYEGTTTGTVRGQRVFRTLQFVAARNQEPEPFFRGGVSAPDQDRVFIAREGSSRPELFVTGSIRQVQS